LAPFTQPDVYAGNYHPSGALQVQDAQFRAYYELAKDQSWLKDRMDDKKWAFG
jgi:hypothetical protein